MHYPPPTLLASALASTLAAALAPAQAQAPTAGSAAWSLQAGRTAVGSVVETFEAAAEEAYLVAQALPEPGMEVVSDAAPLPPAGKAPRVGAAHGAPLHAGHDRAQIVVAQATPTPPARPAASRPPAARPAQAEIGPANAGPVRPCTAVTVDPPTQLTLGKSQVVRLPFPVARLIVGGGGAGRAGRPAGSPAPAGAQPAPPPGAAQVPPPGGQPSGGVAETDVTLLSPTELFFLGRQTGSMNVVLQANDGRCLVKDLVVTVDPGTLQATLKDLMPDESGLRVRGAEDSLVLSGTVSDALKLQEVMAIAGTYADTKKVVNLIRVAAPQQVMLEVQIAEVSKNLLDRLGSAANISRVTNGGRNTFSLITDFLTGAGGLVQALRKGHTNLAIDAQMNDGVVRVLAEPNIMAISGQSASFLSGGKIFIPVAHDPGFAGGFGTIRLEEKEFGVGLKFTPTVLDGRVNLKVTSEVSELSQTGTPFTTVGNVTAILPSMTTRRVDTTVQLADGQSFVVAGLIKNNVTEAINKFPGLGETPIVGALFRSTEFQSDLTELMFVVTPRLVKPLTATPPLPTDNHVVPGRREFMLQGNMEGDQPAAAPGTPTVPAAAPAR